MEPVSINWFKNGTGSNKPVPKKNRSVKKPVPALTWTDLIFGVINHKCSTIKS